MKKSKKVIPIKTPPFTIIDEMDVKYTDISLENLLKWIKERVPEGTKDENIILEYDIDTEWGYYDDYIAIGKLILKVKND